MSTKTPEKYCYAVFCNPHPSLLYAVYENKWDAVRYAINLIRWRKDEAQKRGFEFGFYNFLPFISKYRTIKNLLKKENGMRDELWREHCVFAASLKIKDGREEYSDDGCQVRVLRYPLR